MLNPRHIITEKKRIIELYEAGASLERIAYEIDLSQEHLKVLQTTIELLVQRDKINMEKRMAVIGDTNKAKQILMEHKAEIIELFEQGFMAIEIVRKLMLPTEYRRELEMLLGNLLQTKQIEMQKVTKAREERESGLAAIEQSKYRKQIQHQKQRLEVRGYTVEQLAKIAGYRKEYLSYLIQEGIVQGIIDEEKWKQAQVRRQECMRLLKKGLTRSQLMEGMGLSLSEYNYLLQEEDLRVAREKGKQRLEIYKMGLNRRIITR